MIDVFWWSKSKTHNCNLENFGDFLVPYILDRTTSEKYKWVEPLNRRRYKLFSKKHFFIIGSILHFATKNTIVWGAGIISQDSKVDGGKFLAVRGPLTRKKLLNLGFKVPEKFGDPALLLALLERKNKTHKKYLLGIVPHFVDFNEASRLYKFRQDVKIINVLTHNPQDVINQICECEYILSSSLHGIIVSHALEIPALWTTITDNLYGDNIKFYDYYQSIGIETPLKIEFSFLTREATKTLFESTSGKSLPSGEKLNSLLQDLITTFPFKKSEYFKSRIKAFHLKLKG